MGEAVYALQKSGERLCIALRKIADGEKNPATIAEAALEHRADDKLPDGMIPRAEHERIVGELREALQGLLEGIAGMDDPRNTDATIKLMLETRRLLERTKP